MGLAAVQHNCHARVKTKVLHYDMDALILSEQSTVAMRHARVILNTTVKLFSLLLMATLVHLDRTPM